MRHGDTCSGALRDYFHAAAADLQTWRIAIDAIVAFMRLADDPVVEDHGHRRALRRLRGFHHRRAGQQLDAGIGQRGVDHADGALLADAQKDSGREQNFRAALFGAQFGAFGYRGEFTEVRGERLSGDGDRAFKEVNHTGSRGDDRLPKGSQRKGGACRQ